MEVVGRNREIKKLNKKLSSPKAELIAILGRRRVGKTYLIREHYRNHMFFHYTGLFHGLMEDQLMRFGKALDKTRNDDLSITSPSNWFEAFDFLATVISKSRSKKKKVIFLDEFPWIATNKSKFLTAFTDFWNSFAVTRQDLIVVICGSSASWMINKVLKNKGGLHNRVTDRIILEPFTLAETELFLQSKNIVINRHSIVQLYMGLGGIPFYLDQIDMGESVIQAMDRLCFQKGSLLQLEYDELFASLFNNATKHEKIIEALSKKPMGMDRETLLQKTNLKSGGGFTSILHELEHSGFIAEYIPYGKKRNQKRYKLTDFYTIFYLKYIKPHISQNENTSWKDLATSHSWTSWSGLAFENVCMYHIPQIKKALKIDGIISKTSTLYAKGTDEMQGTQIDLLIDRADGIINICELKFSAEPYLITKAYAHELRTKMTAFKYFTKSKKTLFPTMVTTHGIIDNKYSKGFIQNSVSLEDLFVNT